MNDKYENLFLGCHGLGASQVCFLLKFQRFKETQKSFLKKIKKSLKKVLTNKNVGDIIPFADALPGDKKTEENSERTLITE